MHFLVPKRKTKWYSHIYQSIFTLMNCSKCAITFKWWWFHVENEAIMVIAMRTIDSFNMSCGIFIVNSLFGIFRKAFLPTNLTDLVGISMNTVDQEWTRWAKWGTNFERRSFGFGSQRGFHTTTSHFLGLGHEPYSKYTWKVAIRIGHSGNTVH